MIRTDLFFWSAAQIWALDAACSLIQEFSCVSLVLFCISHLPLWLYSHPPSSCNYVLNPVLKQPLWHCPVTMASPNQPTCCTDVKDSIKALRKEQSWIALLFSELPTGLSLLKGDSAMHSVIPLRQRCEIPLKWIHPPMISTVHNLQ